MSIFLKQSFRHYLTQPHSNTNYVKFIKDMQLFPSWASSYWCYYIVKHPDKTPDDLILQSPFTSFFFRPCEFKPFVSPLFMQICSAVYMATYILKRSWIDFDSFANEYHWYKFKQILDVVPVFPGGQGDWKCENCGDMPGVIHICGICAKPCKNWQRYIFSF